MATEGAEVSVPSPTPVAETAAGETCAEFTWIGFVVGLSSGLAAGMALMGTALLVCCNKEVRQPPCLGLNCTVALHHAPSTLYQHRGGMQRLYYF